MAAGRRFHCWLKFLSFRLKSRNLLLLFRKRMRCLDCARYDKRKMNQSGGITRREAARLICAGAAGLLWPIGAVRGKTTNESSTMLMRAIPSSGEKLPVIGLGTWQTFDVDLTSENQKQSEEVLSLFVK